MFAHYALGHRRNLPTGLILAAGIAALLAATPALAATWTWDGSEGNDNWTNTPNWTPASAVANDGTADLIFGATPRPMPNMNANWSVNSVTFNNTAGAYTLTSLTGSTLTVGAGGITDNDADNQIINHAITLSAPQTWSVPTGYLAIEGAVNNGGNLLTIDTGASGLASIIGLNGDLGGAGGLTKNGLGTLGMSGGAKTYAGTTRVNAGRLEVFGSSVVSFPGSLEIGDGVGTAIDTVFIYGSNTIADSATVSVFSTGTLGFDIASETITNLNIDSTGIAGGGLVSTGLGTLSILGNVTMTGGTVAPINPNFTSILRLNGNLITNASNIVATISSQFDLNNGTHAFTIADGAALNDLDVTGVVSNGGIMKDGFGTLRLGAANTYAGGTTLNAGTILLGHDSALGIGPLTGNGGTLRPDGAALTITNALNGSFVLDCAFDVTLNSSVNIAGNITKIGDAMLIFAQAGAIFDGLTVNAGAVRLDAAVSFTGGLTNSATLLIGTQTLTVNGAGLNNQGSLPLAGNVVAGTAMFSNNAGGTVSGHGTISAPFANAGGTLRVVGGTMNVTGDFANSGVIRLDGGEALVGGAITNTGLIQGDGTISNPLNNAAGGELRADPGKSLTFTDSGSNANAGLIRLLGGALDFQADLTNQAGAFISGNGSLLTGGLTNHGTMNFAGTANIVGDVANSATGKVISGGGGATIFYDDVTNDGEIRTSTNGFTVFFGSVSGSGTFTGTGTVNFEGDLSPGNSPATVEFAGDVGFGPDASLLIELGGTTPGLSHDQVVVDGDLTLDGTLGVSILPDFTPTAGQSFDILDWGSIGGEFSSLNLPMLTGLTWNTSQLYTDGILSLTAAGLPGDYNQNGVVDAADYTLWRDNFGSTTSLPNDDTAGVGPDDYDRWKTHFGQTAGSGAGGSATAAVPEPASISLAALSAVILIAIHRRPSNWR